MILGSVGTKVELSFLRELDGEQNFEEYVVILIRGGGSTST